MAYPQEKPEAVCANTNVTPAVTSFTILAANAKRKDFKIYNNSAADLFISYAATTSLTLFSYRIPTLTAYEPPAKPVWPGIITAISTVTTANAICVTEIT